MIIKDNYYSPTGYTWVELRILFEALSVLQHENSGMRNGFTRIVGDIHWLDHCNETFSQYHAFVYLAARASSHMKPLVSSLNNTTETHMHNRVYASFSAFHLLYACTANPYPRYTTLPPLASFLTQYAVVNKKDIDVYSHIIFTTFAKYIQSGVYKGVPELQHGILVYLDKIRTGDHPLSYKNNAVDTCCNILALI
jgi:hypothetical protein